MRSSCIRHPEKEPLLLIRQWQMDVCKGNACAAALLSFFEYWHNIKLEQSSKSIQANDTAEKHGDARNQDESLVQYHNTEQLEKGLLHLYARSSIKAGIDFLSSLGFLRVMRNPNPRFAFDATKHFVFNDDAVNDWLEKRYSSNEGGDDRIDPNECIDALKIADASTENSGRSTESRQRSAESSESLLKETPKETPNNILVQPQLQPTPRRLIFRETGSPAKSVFKAEEPKPKTRPRRKPATASKEAEEIYAAYPYKVARPVALKIIDQQIEKHGAALLLEKVKEFAVARGGDLEYCPMPATWFGQERFLDDPTSWKPRKNIVQPQPAFDRNAGTYNANSKTDYSSLVRQGSKKVQVQ